MTQQCTACHQKSKKSHTLRLYHLALYLASKKSLVKTCNFFHCQSQNTDMSYFLLEVKRCKSILKSGATGIRLGSHRRVPFLQLLLHSLQSLTQRCGYVRSLRVFSRLPEPASLSTTSIQSQCLSTTRKAGRVRVPATVATRGATAGSACRAPLSSPRKSPPYCLAS